ncbi:MAG: hypothetical protein AAGU32_21155, partial [Bacillota bacterium]
MGKSNKQKSIRFWPLKVLLVTLVLTAGISVVTELLMDSMSVTAAVFIVLFIMLIGILFDIIGIAFATCDTKPFVSMASKRIKRARSAIRLLQNAGIVSNICGDVVGDICGIVSGAAGAAIAIKVAITANSTEGYIIAIAISSVIAALTISGKAIGKNIAIRNNKEIVSFISYVLMFFLREGKKR